MKKLDYIEIDNIKLYLRKNILEDYLTGDEKRKIRGRHPRADKYLLNSKELLKLERIYRIYEERVFTLLYGKELIIKKEDIKIREENKEIELKAYLKSQNILIRQQDYEPKTEIIIEENKIKKMDSSMGKIKRVFKKKPNIKIK